MLFLINEINFFHLMEPFFIVTCISKVLSYSILHALIFMCWAIIMLYNKIMYKFVHRMLMLRRWNRWYMYEGRRSGQRGYFLLGNLYIQLITLHTDNPSKSWLSVVHQFLPGKLEVCQLEVKFYISYLSIIWICLLKCLEMCINAYSMVSVLR